jgi:MSHA biogenesis protein MshM
MYLNHFGFNQQPFSLSPNTGFYVGLASSREALNVLLVALRSGEGFVKIVGEVGTGKTLLCRKMLNSLGSSFVTVFLPDPTLAPMDLRRAIADELGIPITPETNQYLLSKYITEELAEIHRSGKSVVLLIDEAQALSTVSLEYVRLLTNLECENHKLIQVVLFGQPELDRRLAQAPLRQLRQRITFSHRLAPVSRAGLRGYVTRRLAVAGYESEELFSPAALRVLHRASRGIPRLINILCHKSLMCAYGRGDRSVQAFHLRRAAADTEDVHHWKKIRLAVRRKVASS